MGEFLFGCETFFVLVGVVVLLVFLFWVALPKRWIYVVEGPVLLEARSPC